MHIYITYNTVHDVHPKKKKKTVHDNYRFNFYSFHKSSVTMIVKEQILNLKYTQKHNIWGKIYVHE